MDNLISIDNLKDSTIEFDIETQGFDKNVGVSARLVVSASPVTFAFNCEKEAGKWVCKIPAMSYLKPSAYPFTVEVVIDGYFFEALRGTLNIVATKDVYVSIPQSAKTIEPPTAEDKEEQEEESKSKPIPVKTLDINAKPVSVKNDKQEPPKNTKDVASLAKKIMADVENKEKKEDTEKKKETKKPVETKKEELSEEQKRAIIVKEILDSVITGKKPKRKFSIRDQVTFESGPTP